jgi:methyl-accepting chemotaxis protein
MVAAHDSAIFNVRILNALDKCSTNVMIADAHNVILFMNETAKALMLNCQPALQQSLSQFDASQLLGRDMVLFHPSLGKEAMTAVSCTWRSEIQLGSLHFGLVANPILDAAGARVGTVLEWTDRTTEVGIENQIAVVVQAAAQGKFDQRLHVSSQNGFFATLSTGMNQLLHTSEQGLTDVAHVLSAFAQGDLTQRIESAYAGLYGDVKKGLSI